MLNRNVFTIFLFISSLLTTSVASALCVNVPEANLRQGPSTQYEKSWKVYKHMPFKKVGQRDAWYKVIDVDGDVHWIHKTLVSERIRCAVVKVDKANVRTGQGTHHEKAPFSPVEKYYSFHVVGAKEGWVEVEDEYGNRGWMSMRLLWMP